MTRFRRLARRVGPPLLAFALLAVVLRSVSLPVIWQTLGRIEWYEVLLLLAVNGLLLLAMTSRWWLLLHALGHSIPYLRLTGYRLTAFGISYFTPGPHFGGEPYQVYVVAKHNNVGYADAIASVSLDKLLEMLINFAFLAAAVVIVLPGTLMGSGFSMPMIAAALVMVSIPVAILIALWYGRHPVSGAVDAGQALWQSLRGHSRTAHGGDAPRWLSTLHRSEDQATLVCRTRPGHLLAAVATSILTWCGMIGEYWLMTAMLDISLSPVQMLTSLFAARVAILLPFPAALGALEASQALAMSAASIAPGAGVGLSLLIRARDVFFGVLGIWLGGASAWRDYRSGTHLPHTEETVPLGNSAPKPVNP